MVQVKVENRQGSHEGIQEGATTKSVSSRTSPVSEAFPTQLMLDSWDQIGKMNSEITKSLMQKQASMISERCRKGEARLKDNRPYKKRRIIRASSTEDPEDASATVSDDEHHPKGQTKPSLPVFLSQHVERMASMSKFIMEIEYCHGMLREEIRAMANEE
jgi:hypothetical protein